ncbi:MAG: 23S rRNA (pseudouridine(1915)-N(3))-methyltransferase RlmH [Deferribacteres bacterium]|nr:23S rRNA (pseudouridine(1915)-N(3))-methyltransferase RlmH [candidate division KSB1 bacterium]MCB9500894.1 23S rRNA (pseudouridine(1915)-N(3))-methyltransferase RlmH [Deferribacteres bacterium]
MPDMKITVYAFGKMKTKFWLAACNEFAKRLQHYVSFELKELKDSRFNEKNSSSAIEDESARLLSMIPSTTFFVALDGSGSQFSSLQFARFFEEKQNFGPAEIAFAIGGAFGFSQAVLQRADLVLSLSQMTFPHELARVILFEQIYRAFTILRGEKYHK